MPLGVSFWLRFNTLSNRVGGNYFCCSPSLGKGAAAPRPLRRHPPFPAVGCLFPVHTQGLSAYVALCPSRMESCLLQVRICRTDDLRAIDSNALERREVLV